MKWQMNNDQQLRRQLDEGKPTIKRNFEELLILVVQSVILGIIRIRMRNNCFLFLIGILIVLYVWNFYKRRQFKKNKWKLFKMTKTNFLLCMDLLEIVIGSIVLITYMVHLYNLASYIIDVFFLLMVLYLILLVGLHDEVTQDIRAKVWSKFLVKHSCLIDDIDRGSRTMRHDVFNNKYSFDMGIKTVLKFWQFSYSEYMTIDYIKRKQWTEYIHSLDDTTVAQLEYLIDKSSPRMDINSKILDFLRNVTFVLLLAFGVSETTNSYNALAKRFYLAPHVFSAILIAGAVVYLLVYVQYRMIYNDNNNANEYILSLIKQEKR